MTTIHDATMNASLTVRGPGAYKFQTVLFLWLEEVAKTNEIEIIRDRIDWSKPDDPQVPNKKLIEEKKSTKQV